MRRAERLALTGDVAAAEALTRGVLQSFQAIGEELGAAAAASRIADILQARGELDEARGKLDEALRIYREEVLPVDERLGAVRERAVTLQKIASGLITRRAEAGAH